MKFLRLLVTVLTGTMIAGVVIIIALLVIRLRPADLPLPDVITLPGAERATAFTQGPDWYAVVTAQDEILIFGKSDGALRQRIAIEPGNPG